MELTLIIGLIAAGILLLLLEVFLPGGVAGALGVVCLVVGTAVGFVKGPGIGYPNLGWYLLTGILTLGPIALWAWIKYFPRSRFGRQIMLEQDAGGWRGFDTARSNLVGRTGIAHTDLHPSGTALIDDERVDVITQGEMVDKGTPIKVLKVVGNRTIVAAQPNPVAT